MMQEPEPRGLGGWLILVAIGLVVTVANVSAFLVDHLVPLLTGPRWSHLIDKTNALYQPLLPLTIIYEVVGNTLVLLAALVGLILFFRRSRGFPRLMIWYYVGATAFLAVDHVLGGMIPTIPAAVHARGATRLARAVIVTLIWVPYMLRSRRVRNTFCPPPQPGDLGPGVEVPAA